MISKYERPSVLILKQQLQATLLNEIPLTQAMGIEVKIVTKNSITLVAPLGNNINHKCTAFGGSLYSVAVLSGWGLLFTQLSLLNIQAHIVIQESDIKYIHPVTTAIEATCCIESRSQFKKFIAMYQKKGIARITLNAVVKGDDEAAVIFQGKYVIHE